MFLLDVKLPDWYLYICQNESLRLAMLWDIFCHPFPFPLYSSSRSAYMPTLCILTVCCPYQFVHVTMTSPPGME